MSHLEKLRHQCTVPTHIAPIRTLNDLAFRPIEINRFEFEHYFHCVSLCKGRSRVRTGGAYGPSLPCVKPAIMQMPPLAVIESWPLPNYVNPVTRGPANIIINLVFLPLVCLVIALRVYTRLRISKSFGVDDWLILASLVCAPF